MRTKKKTRKEEEYNEKKKEEEEENGRLVIDQNRMKQYNYVQQKKHEIIDVSSRIKIAFRLGRRILNQ
jgi:hypothetical protein